MARWLLTIGVMLVSVAGVVAQYSGPLISIEKTVHDFGPMKRGTTKEHKFVVKNTGKSPLLITKVEPDCGCTVVDYTKEPIMPGKTGYISAKMDTRGRGTGAFNKGITVSSNGGTVVCRIKGNVLREAPPEPDDSN